MKDKDINLSHKEVVVASQYTRERDYWLYKLAAPPDKTIFPYDGHYNGSTPGKTGKEINLHTTEFQFPAQLCERFIRIINKSDSRLHMVLVAGIVVLLEAYTGSKDIILGAPVLKQKQDSQAEFINTVLLLRNQLHPRMTFKELLLQVKQTIMDASKHVNYPLEAILNNLDIPFKDMDFPLFDIVVLLQNIHEKEYIHHIHYNMLFSFCRTGEHINGVVKYNASRYHKTTIERIAIHYRYLMSQVLFNVDLPLSEIDIIPGEEKKQLLYDFNFTGVGIDYVKDKTLHGLVEEQVRKTPDHIALVAHSPNCKRHDEPGGARNESPILCPVRSAITYQELNEKANRISRYLKSLGVKVDSIAGIMAEGSVEMVIGILAVLKTGAAYLPLAPEYPENRIGYMLKDSNIKVLLTHRPWFMSGIDHDVGLDFNGKVVDIFDEGFYKSKDSGVVPAGEASPPGKASSYAYLVYTSGSTGRPKGVLVNHSGVVHMLRCRKNEYQMAEKAVSLQLFSCSFDGFVTSFFTPVISGAKVVLMALDEVKNIDAIKTAIVKNGVTHFIAVPVLYRLIIDCLSKREASSLEVVTLAGDSLSPDLVEMTRAKSEKLEISNEYGVTEASVMSTVYRHQELTSQIKIGHPLRDTHLYILNTRDQLQPIGVGGELCIAGAGVAAGYINNVELTAEKFVEQVTGAGDRCRGGATTNKKFLRRQKIYRTGDLARWLADGNIEFLGRKQQQQQVKIRGYRVELKEIKEALLKHPEITDALVMIKASASPKTGAADTGERNICAYIVPRREGENRLGTLSTGLRDYLSAVLPAYMIPTYFEELEKIPLTPNGKIDLKSLPEPVLQGSETYTAPRDSIEKKLVEIWSEVLARDASAPVADYSTKEARTTSSRRLQHREIGIDDNFFDLGGDSLRASILIARIHEKLNTNVPLAELFERQTIRGLADYMKENTREDTFASLEAVEKKEYYALSSAQMRLFILQQMEPDNTVYNLPMVRLLEEKAETARFEETFQELIKRHESLRTSYHQVKGQPVQRIHDEVKFEIDCYDLTAREWHRKTQKNTKKGKNKSDQYHGPSDPEGLEIRVRNYIKNLRQSFDLSQAPLLRVKVIKIKNSMSLLMVDMHHIITDGVSHSILYQEFISLHQGKELAPLRIHYKDFTHWQKSQKEKESIKKQEAYWLRQLEGEIPVLNLPFDYARPALQSFEGSTVHFGLPAKDTRALKAIALEKQATLYMVTLAIFNVLLAKLSSQEDIIVGTPTAGRRHADLERVIGMFVNTLVMRNQPGAEKTFVEFLQEVKEKALEAFENQEYQFEDLVDHVLVNRDAGRNPLFDVMYTLQNFVQSSDGDEAEANRVKVTESTVGETPTADLHPREDSTDFTGLTKFDITFNGMEDSEIISYNVEYCTKLFKRETIDRFVSYFKKVVSLVIKESNMKLGEMEIISEEEKKTILSRFNDINTRYPGDETIHRLFAAQAEQIPDHIALVHSRPGALAVGKEENIYLTYRELNGESHQLAHLLKEKGVQPDTIVALMVERSLEMIIGILGILKAGGAYMPIDPEYPQERVNYMLEDSKVKILVGKGNVFSGMKGGHELFVLNFEHLNFEFVSNFEFRASNLNSSNLAYVIYTSGTTGKPKGSLVEHRNVVQLMFHDNYLFDFSRSDVWTMFHSYCFDFSVWEMYGALLYGGRLILIAKMTARDPQQYLDLLEKQRVTVLNQTPAAFYSLVDQDLKGPKRQLNLRYVIFGGEALVPVKLEPWYNRYPGTKLINMFGITETTVHVTFKELGSRDIRLDISNIGQPLPTLSTYVMDKSLKLVPSRTVGELCVGGEGVCRGYLNRPALTGKKFVENPYRPGERLYRSGDLGKFAANGDIEYLGRGDLQVKIRGYRIELGEIESQLLKYPGIKEAVVIERRDENGDNYLCAYTAARSAEPGAWSAAELREYLSQTLPDYMIPSYFMHIEKIPLTPNGKIDRKALPAPEINPAEAYAAPRNEIEEKLVEIWTNVLQGDVSRAIGIDDNFFEIGGHSLKATVMTAVVHKELNVQLPLAEVFLAPTIRDLAGFIKRAAENRFVSIEPAEEKEYYVLSSAQKRLYVLQQINLESNVYNMPEMIPLAEGVDIETLEETFLKLIQRHEGLRTSFHMIDEEPVQRIHEEVKFKIGHFNLRRSEASSSISIKTIARHFIRPFDLSAAPLLRAGMIEWENDRHLLVVDMHHIISDGVSRGIMVRDFLNLYKGETSLPLPLQYRDFAQWQNLEEQKQAMSRQEKYWLKEFEGEIPLLNMPLDFIRPGSFDFEGSTLAFHIDGKLTARIRELTSQLNVTMMMFLLALYNVMLSKYTGQEDILVGTVVAGRRHADLQNIMGFFVNMLAIKTTVHHHKRFSDYLMEVKEKAVNAYENQDYQFEELISKLELQRQPGRHPLVDVVFVLEEKSKSPGKKPGETGTTDQHEKIFKISHFDLMLHATVEKEMISMMIEYSTALFEPKTIKRIADFYLEILDQVLGNEHIKLGEITSGHQFATVESNLLQGTPDFDF